MAHISNRVAPVTTEDLPHKTVRAATSAFIQALQTFERTGEVEDLAALFGDDAILSHVAVHDAYQGTGGVTAFWLGYRQQFENVHTEFTNVFENHGGAALEWTARGRLKTHRDFAYDGISVFDLTPNGRIRRFRTYYDAAAFKEDGAGRTH